MKEETIYIKGTCRPTILTRWWLRVCECTPDSKFDENGLEHAVHEFYVPWWGWLFELFHRLIFGRATLFDK